MTSCCIAKLQIDSIWMFLPVKLIEDSWQNDVKERHASVVCSLYLLTPPPLSSSSSASVLQLRAERDRRQGDEWDCVINIVCNADLYILSRIIAIACYNFAHVPCTTCKFPYLIVLFTIWTPLGFKICHVIFHLFLPLRPDKVGPCCHCVAPAVILISTVELSTKLRKLSECL